MLETPSVREPGSVAPAIATHTQAVVLDWAGTTVDHGCRAPVAAFLAAFEQAGVYVSESEVREPMGLAKLDHLTAVLAQPAVAERWLSKHDTAPGPEDIERIYRDFLLLQSECVASHSAVIHGCVEAVAWCRSREIGIGSSTGYTRDLLHRVAERARGEGYSPDTVFCADDVSPGRPAPWMCFANARALGVYPMSAVVKVDDTPAGVRAGRNAGAWSVGVVNTGNEVGLSEAALAAMAPTEREGILETARQRLIDAGAHFLLDSIADLPEVVSRIDERLTRGEGP